MSHTSWNLNNDRYLNQIGSGLWGGDPELIIGPISGATHMFMWKRGSVSNDYRLTVGSSRGAADIHVSNWLGDIGQYQVSNVPSTGLWVRLSHRLGQNDPEHIDVEYSSTNGSLWNDSLLWDDSQIWSDA